MQRSQLDLIFITHSHAHGNEKKLHSNPNYSYNHFSLRT